MGFLNEVVQAQLHAPLPPASSIVLWAGGDPEPELCRTCFINSPLSVEDVFPTEIANAADWALMAPIWE